MIQTDTFSMYSCMLSNCLQKMVFLQRIYDASIIMHYEQTLMNINCLIKIENILLNTCVYCNLKKEGSLRKVVKMRDSL